MRTFILKMLAVLGLFAPIGCESYSSLKSTEDSDAADSSAFLSEAGVEARATHSFGLIASADKISHSFQIVNETNSRLYVKDGSDISTSCGCTSYELSKWDLAPGERTDFLITVDCSMKIGEFQESAIVRWIDKDKDLVNCRMNVSGTVPSSLILHPDSFYISQPDLESSEALLVKVTSDVAVNWDSLECETSDASIIWTIRPSQNQMNSREVAITFNHQSLVLPMSGDIIFQVDSKTERASKYRRKLPFHVEAGAETQISPLVLMLKERVIGEYQGSLFFLRSTNFDIEDVLLEWDAAGVVGVSKTQRLSPTVVRLDLRFQLRRSEKVEMPTFLKVQIGRVTSEIAVLLPSA